MGDREENWKWRELGRRVGIEYRRNHETQKHEMKEVIGLHFPFSHPSAFRDFRVLAYPAVAVHLNSGFPKPLAPTGAASQSYQLPPVADLLRRGSTSLASTSPSW